MPPPSKVKSRPLAGYQTGGPDAKSADITAISITPRVVRPSLIAAAYSIDQLPPHIGRRISVDPVSGCWVAGPPHDRDGYARLGKEGLHRAVYRLLTGSVPPGKVLDHREDWGCRSKACCRPAHLLPVTNNFNLNRSRITKTRCDNGHEYDLLNTYWRPSGQRDCRACIRARVAKYQARLKGADVSRKQVVQDAAGRSERRAA